MEKKMTKRELFTKVIEHLRTNNLTELVEGMEHELDLLNRKNTTKSNTPTEKQVVNEKYKTEIIAFLKQSAPTAFSIAELWKSVAVLAENPDMTNQRISALLRQLGENGSNEVVKVYEKGKAYFKIAEGV